MYHAIVRNNVTKLFAALGRGDVDTAVAGMARRFEHIFPGNHTLGGVRHTRAGIRAWLEWLMRVCLLVFVLAAAAFLSAVMAMRFAIQGREVDMPNLAGKTSADVQQLLAARGLQLKIADRIYSDLPVNTVVRQSPPAGAAGRSHAPAAAARTRRWPR